MVLINGEEFEIYELDTRQSILSRIAVNMNTLPKFLYFPNGFPDDPKQAGEIDVIDILREIKNNATRSTEFKDFINGIKKQIPKGLDVKRDILPIWLAYNTEIAKLERFSSVILDQIGETLTEEGYYDSEDMFKRFWEDRREIVKRELERAIQEEDFTNKKHGELYKVFDAIDQGLVYTDFETEKVKLQINLNLKEITLLELFNHILLSEATPFAICKDYYKILKDFVPPEEWTEKSEEEVIMKVCERVLVEHDKYKDYTDVRIRVDGDIGQENVVAAMKLQTARGYLKRDQFIKRFISVFNGLGDISYGKMNETEVVGIFYFPMERLDTYVFADLVMNNRLFSSLINIDESTKTTKKKSEFSQPWLYIHFNHPSTGHVTAAITQQTVNRADPAMREQDSDLFPHGEPYIRVRVKGRDRHSVEIFQQMISKLLVIYGNEYNEIVEKYRVFLPNFGEVEELEVAKRKESPEMIAPEVFVKNYSRFCNSARMPTILDKKKAKKARKKGKQVMKFPRDKQDSEPHYESDGNNQQYYVCLNPEFPYPGLQNNNLANSGDFPYVPCCFKVDQKDKQGSAYRSYFFNEQMEEKEKRQQDLIITDKILSADQYGALPNELEKFFEILDSEPNYRYIRVGLHRNHSNFLNAVMVALHEQTNILDLEDEEEREAELVRIRGELAKESIAPLCRQCAYDLSTKEAQKEIENPIVYLDPKVYTQLLEGYFNCNIFLFSKERTMFLPNHLQNYYKKKNNAPCIFIYEHMGSESDRAKYPQSELIVRWNIKKSEDTQYLFPYSQNISKKVQSVFKMLRESYALDKRIYETVMPLSENISTISQKIDTYGKTRQINISLGGKNMTLLTSPIAPMAVKEDSNMQIVKTKPKYAFRLFKEVGGNVLSQTLLQNTLKEINGKIGTVLVTIPVVDSGRIDNVPISDVGMHYAESSYSEIGTYNRNKKLARYITEYVFWLFSKYVHRNGKEKIDDKLLKSFAKKKIKIVKDFKYGPVPKIFSENSGVMDSGKLVVTDEDMLKRILYVLKLYSIRDLSTLMKYRNRNVITHYYVDITDFDQFPRQVILHGEETVDKWIQENKFVYKLHDAIIIGQRSPYFFKNKLVSDQVFLAQNTESLEKAIDISAEWQVRGYNVGNYSKKNAKQYNFTLFAYKNNEDIVSRDVVGGETPRNPIFILGYKLSGMPYYTALLSFD